MSLPWELLRDARGWLFQGKRAVRVRRRLPNRHRQAAHPTGLPLRILLVSPRPEEEGRCAYFDHRASARPLTDALESLGDLARLTVLAPPTYAALEKALQAGDQGQPFDVVHFDGHGVYDPKLGMGGLCFEDAKDEAKLEGRAMQFVDAATLAALVRDHRIPLVFLDACQSAAAEVNPTASVAASLLQEGVASVVAMSHSVLVETARRFVQAFYGELAGGARVGKAMLAGQQALFGEAWRGKVMGAGELRLCDWFVPVLFQEEQDPQLITRLVPQDVRALDARALEYALGALPPPPSHQFQGRSRELLALERLLARKPWAVVRGIGGAGKTALAAELARWLVRTGRFERAAFVSLEHHRDARAVLDALGHQLLPDGEKYSAAGRAVAEAALPVERALRDEATLIILDNCESVLGDEAEAAAQGAAPPQGGTVLDAGSILDLCRRHLLPADSRTRLLFTTREALPAPFDARGQVREMGALDRADAIALVSRVMAEEGLDRRRPTGGNTGGDRGSGRRRALSRASAGSPGPRGRPLRRPGDDGRSARADGQAGARAPGGLGELPVCERGAVASAAVTGDAGADSWAGRVPRWSARGGPGRGRGY